MAIASGVEKQVIYKVQGSGLGTLATAGTAGQILRRVTSGIELKKNTFQSNEIRTDYQISDFRHGSRYIEGGIQGEISPGTYAELMAAGVRGTFAAVKTAITTLSMTSTYNSTTKVATWTRASGSFLTGGLRAGDVVKWTAGSFNASNNSKHLVVLSVTALTFTAIALNGSDQVAESVAVTGATLTFVGKKVITPTSGHVSPYYTIEQYYGSGANFTEVFGDCRVSGLDIQLPASGMATIGINLMGRSMSTQTGAYFSGNTAANGLGVCAGANGILIVSGAPVGNVTGMNFQLNGNMSKEDVVGAATTPDVFQGSVAVSGQMTVLLQDKTFVDMFKDETEASIIMTLSTDNTALSDFVGFTLPRIKAGGNSKDDGQKGIVQTVPFTALYNSAAPTTSGNEQTTLAITDSQAP